MVYTNTLKNGTEVQFNMFGNDLIINGELPTPIFSNDTYNVYETDYEINKAITCVILNKNNTENTFNYNRIIWNDNYKVIDNAIIDFTKHLKSQLHVLTNNGLFICVNDDENHPFNNFNNVDDFLEYYNINNVKQLNDVLKEWEYKIIKMHPTFLKEQIACDNV